METLTQLHKDESIFGVALMHTVENAGCVWKITGIEPVELLH